MKKFKGLDNPIVTIMKSSDVVTFTIACPYCRKNQDVTLGSEYHICSNCFKGFDLKYNGAYVIEALKREEET